MKRLAVVAATLLGLAGGLTPCAAQDAAPPPGPATAVWSDADLDQMLGPIALYPDPLVGLILPAATMPSQIVVADRYLNEGGDPDQISSQPWDASVQGLAHYPTVLKWMDENLAWTTELGEAFANQQSEVMESIQRLRAKAQALGNLPSTPQENVENDSGAIDIMPVDENEVYVPEYQPDLIYYQPGIYCSFGIGFPIGLWFCYDWDWHHHHLITWDRDHRRPPGWWHLTPSRRQGLINTDTAVWRPKPHPGSVFVGGGDRGYENRPVYRTYAAPKLPATRTPARTVETHRVTASAPSRAPEAPRASVFAPSAPKRAPEVSRPVERSEPSESVFGGSQSAHEVRASSSRGQESRGSISSGSARSGGSSGHH
jgi:hypothetical protein